jgi:hypothetical protein
VYLVSLLSLEFWVKIKNDLTIRNRVRIVGAAVFVTVVVFALAQKLFSSFLANVTNLSYIKYNLTLAGGYSTVNPWLVVGGFSLCLWWGHRQTTNDDHSKLSLVAALLVPVIGLFTWSYFLAPYIPQYGAWKYLYVAAAVSIPWAIVITARLLENFLSLTALAQAPLVLLLALGLFTPPFQHLNWVNTVRGTDYEWVDSVTNELRRNSQRAVVCLNTFKGDEGRNYDAYLCSRMSLGLGGFDTYEHRTWTAANICQIGPEQARLAWDGSFQENLTVLMFDDQRTSSFASCQSATEGTPNGWLSFVDWNVVKKLSPNGDVVNIQPTKAGD